MQVVVQKNPDIALGGREEEKKGRKNRFTIASHWNDDL